MIPRPPRSTRTYPLVPSTTLFRSARGSFQGSALLCRGCDGLGRSSVRLTSPDYRFRAIRSRATFASAEPFGGRVAPEGRVSRPTTRRTRSEEHTSEIQSLMRISYAVFCLKKKTKTQHNHDEK